jgi:hypothetical protein
MCDAYTCACIHQLRFSMSFSRASAPLELVFFSDVWGVRTLIPSTARNTT